MTRKVTPTAVKRIITKGLTGWEAGKLILQDLTDSYSGRNSVLTETDMETIRGVSMEGIDVRDYNMFMALCRGFHMGHILGEWTCVDAGLQISFLDGVLRDANKRRTVELFESFGPRVVTRKQYKDIVAAQREKKLAFEYSLGYVIEERFYEIAPSVAREEIDELCIDIESAKDFASVIPEKFTGFFKQAVDQIHHLVTCGKLRALCQKEDKKKTEPLLTKWKKGRLSTQDIFKLLDTFYITGQQLYECEQLPEWKPFINEYQQYWLSDEDERFRHTYAVLEDNSTVWIDEQGYYKGPKKSSEWITRGTESLLGLVDHNDKAKKSIKRVGAELRDRLDTAEQNIRMFLAIKAILDTAADAVELDIPGKAGMLAGPNIRIGAFIALYNIRLEELHEERKSSKSGESRLEKALKMLPTIDPEKLRPSPDSLKQLKDNILKDAQGEEWLRIKVRSLEYDDGFSFRELTEKT
ncbi:MAG: hypothetical protein GY774_26670 [Planctomycetes bacterium]|nr:hypothetical protein [Planctomycetota bacterium]